MLLQQLPLQPSFFTIITLLTLTLSPTFCFSSSNDPTTIYQILRVNGLPMGLLPKGVTNFTFDDSGRFEVYLDQACNSKFENELHYDRNISGRLSFGRVDEVSGISAHDLFLWFMVKKIRVDIPSSGLIYFDVGVVFKQFSLSSFDTPRDCLASSMNDGDKQLIDQNVYKVRRKRCLTFFDFDFDFLVLSELSSDLNVVLELGSGFCNLFDLGE